MRIVCVGGGPAGLAFAGLVKLQDPRHDVTVVERNPAGVTYGWGVVFGERLLAELRGADPVGAGRVLSVATRWSDQHVRVGDRETVHLGGYGYAVGRQQLLEVLTERAVELGARLEYDRDVSDVSDVSDRSAVADADLVVACDGVHSRLRQGDAEQFGTTVASGDNRYLWLGTRVLFDAFTFGFERTPAGWMWFHAYRFDTDLSTFIVECTPSTWERAGFAGMGPDATVSLLESVFVRQLDGHDLLIRRPGQPDASWLSFTGISNRRWSHGKVVLLGDAAHTAHFSIGSGTTLALQDSIALAAALARHPDLPTALARYHEARLPGVLALQAEAARSARWFETAADRMDLDPLDFGYSLLRRRFTDGPTVVRAPLWRYGMHRATQYTPFRRLRERATMARHGRLLSGAG